ncbi:MAG: SDR family oxidoreductase [Emcibacteraceae bacterium]|nr:SDR family oxidoreductase [Emcibacteraceae bacterium]MDG1859106.1 SDR family oxidoreductase [Emcibacteraceae bacterium]
MKLFCFGLGYTARHLVSTLSPQKWQISGTHRIEGDFIFNGEEPLTNASATLKDVTHLLISIAPNQNYGDPVLFHHQQDIINMPSLKWIGYLSATSVYGDHHGNWVDETSTTNPSDNRGHMRLMAEQAWLSLGLPLHIFRLGGIYGPSRNQIAAVKSMTAKKIIKKGHTFSRIHVDDIASALKTTMNNPIKGIYNVVDDEPSSSAEVLDFICDEINQEHIHGFPISKVETSPMLKSFYKDNKKVSNTILKETFSWQPKHPSYKEGYKAILNKLDNSAS